MKTAETTSTVETIEQLNSLLRGEISAAETYAQAIGKLGAEHANEAAQLRLIQERHGRHAQLLREHLEERGTAANKTSGPWGTWAKVVQGTANLLGDAAALKSIKEGEEHGLKDYQAAVEKVDGPIRELIVREMIPAQARHVQVLDDLLTRLG